MEQPTYLVLDQFFMLNNAVNLVKYDALILLVLVLFFKLECWSLWDTSVWDKTMFLFETKLLLVNVSIIICDILNQWK
jgi:hypothetical protein